MLGWGRKPEGEPKMGMPNIGKAEKTVLSGIGAVSLVNAEVEMPKLSDKERVVDVAHEGVTPESREGKESLKDWDVFVEAFPVLERNTSGDVVGVNWKNLLHPTMIGVSVEDSTPKTISVAVPYEYARFFNVGEPISAQDYEKLESHIEQQIIEQTAENIYGLLDADEEHYRQFLQEHGPTGMVKSITVLGEASPESHTIDSIIPGNIEAENLELGEIRAQDADLHVRRVLERLGFVVPDDASRILSAEGQLSQREFAQLQEMATAAGKSGSPEEMVYRLIADYNQGRVTDDATQEALNEIVAAKRKVEIEIELEDGSRDTLLVPQFLLGLLAAPLALAPLAFRRKKEGDEPRPKEKRQRIIDVPPPNEGKDTDVFVRELAVDLFKNFSFYEAVMERHREDEDPDVNEMTHDILDLWTKNDNEIRAKSGLNPEADHRTRPRQVFYANLHARALREVILNARSAEISESHAFGLQDTRDAITRELRQEIERLRAVK